MVTQSGLLSKDALPQQAFDSAMSVADTAGHHTIALLAAMVASLRPGSTVILYEPMQVRGVPVPGINSDVCHCLCLHALRLRGETATCPSTSCALQGTAQQTVNTLCKQLLLAGFTDAAASTLPSRTAPADLIAVSCAPLLVVTWQLVACLGANPPYSMARCVRLHGAGSTRLPARRRASVDDLTFASCHQKLASALPPCR